MNKEHRKPAGSRRSDYRHCAVPVPQVAPDTQKPGIAIAPDFGELNGQIYLTTLTI
jgi:hypothetical protein